MGEALVICKDAANRAGVMTGGVREALFKRLLARAEQRDLPASGDKARQRGEQQVEPLLPGYSWSRCQNKGAS